MITCPSDKRIVSGDSFNRVDNIQAIARFCSEQGWHSRLLAISNDLST